MDDLISADTLRQRLRDLPSREFTAVAARSSVPYSTLHKIRIGETTDPGLETVRKILRALSGRAAD